ncbi:hypothetical protein [Lapidilactobacillus bayanensis]|uniref:hypothetical protein n=1 Tax=Lapidilactobacillus bayanensis TaxID=2485998 RepID=UPI001781028E|nr:hypothetical protein [Lapidilactobacillus bayanensis]
MSHSEKFNSAGILLIEYLKKRQDKIYEIFSAIKSNFDIEDGWGYYLKKRFSILEVFSKQENINKLMALLIVNILDEFLKFSGEKIISNDRNVVINHYTLADGDYLIGLHRKIFDLLFKIYNLRYEEVNNCIDKLLFNYPVYEVKNGFTKTVSSDLKCIEEFFFKDSSKLSIRDEVIIFELSSEAKKLELPAYLFANYKLSKSQEIYVTFSSNRFSYNKKEFNYEEYQKLRMRKLIEVFDEYSDDLLQLFNVFAKYQTDALLNKHKVEESLLFLYSKLCIDDKVKMLTSLLNSKFMLK